MPRLEEWSSSTEFGLQARLQISSGLNQTGLPCSVPQTARLRAGHIHQEASMFHLLWEAIIGLIVGALAKLIMPGKDPGGIIVTMLIGVAGALLATFIGSHVGLYQEGQRAGFIMSLVGAVVILALYRLIRGKSAKS